MPFEVSIKPIVMHLTFNMINLEHVRKINEDQLIAMLKRKNANAFKYLYDNYSPALYASILEIIPNQETAADVLHDVFINIFLKIDTYDASKNKLYTWIMSIARNRSIDILKTKDYRNNIKNEDLSTAITEYVEDDGLVVDHIGMHKLLLKLNEKYRTVIELNYFKGYTHEEIAQILGLPLGTIKTRIRYAVKLLRTILNE